MIIAQLPPLHIPNRFKTRNIINISFDAISQPHQFEQTSALPSSLAKNISDPGPGSPRKTTNTSTVNTTTDQNKPAALKANSSLLEAPSVGGKANTTSKVEDTHSKEVASPPSIPQKGSPETPPKANSSLSDQVQASQNSKVGGTSLKPTASSENPSIPRANAKASLTNTSSQVPTDLTTVQPQKPEPTSNLTKKVEMSKKDNGTNVATQARRPGDPGGNDASHSQPPAFSLLNPVLPLIPKVVDEVVNLTTPVTQKVNSSISQPILPSKNITGDLNVGNLTTPVTQQVNSSISQPIQLPKNITGDHNATISRAEQSNLTTLHSIPSTISAPNSIALPTFDEISNITLPVHRPATPPEVSAEKEAKKDKGSKTKPSKAGKPPNPTKAGVNGLPETTPPRILGIERTTFFVASGIGKSFRPLYVAPYMSEELVSALLTIPFFGCSGKKMDGFINISGCYIVNGSHRLSVMLLEVVP